MMMTLEALLSLFTGVVTFCPRYMFAIVSCWQMLLLPTFIIIIIIIIIIIESIVPSRNIGCLRVLSTSVYQLLGTLVHSSFYPLPWLPIFSSCFSVFLFPWGFQSRAAFGTSPSSFLNVWPIHLNFLFLISKFISSCPVTFHRSLLEIIFGHHILSICLRHLFTKVCILRWISFVTSQVSHPYHSTDFTQLTYDNKQKILAEEKATSPHIKFPRTLDHPFWDRTAVAASWTLVLKTLIFLPHLFIYLVFIFMIFNTQFLYTSHIFHLVLHCSLPWYAISPVVILK